MSGEEEEHGRSTSVASDQEQTHSEGTLAEPQLHLSAARKPNKTQLIRISRDGSNLDDLMVQKKREHAKSVFAKQQPLASERRGDSPPDKRSVSFGINEESGTFRVPGADHHS